MIFICCTLPPWKCSGGECEKPSPIWGGLWCPIRTQLCQRLSGLIPETAKENENQIQNPADAKETHSQQPDDAGADFADVKAVDAEIAQEQAQEEGDPLTFMNVAAEIFIDVGIVVNDIDYGLLRNSAVLGCAALRAKF